MSTISNVCCLAGDVGAGALAVLGVSASASSYVSVLASVVVVAFARSTSIHDAHNSLSGTGRV